MRTVISLAEQITLAPIHLSEYITTTSLIAAHSSINVLSVIFPGSSDASFSLASFIGLVRREWSAGGDDLPKKQYGITQVARAIVAWVALQGVTQEWQEKRWFKYLKEIDVKNAPRSMDTLRARRGSRIRVTSDIIFPGQGGPQIIAADIGEAPTGTRSRAQSILLSRTKSRSSLRSVAHLHLASSTDIEPLPQMSDSELKTTLRRLSKMVLAGYGGASLLFFGVSPTDAYKAATSSNTSGKMPSRRSPAQAEPTSFSDMMAKEKTAEEAQLTHAIDASEAEAAGDVPFTFPGVPSSSTASESSSGVPKPYSWWDVLLGKHDREIFELSAAHDHGDESKHRAEMKETAERKKKEMKEKIKSTAVFGNEHLMPRFWVLTDYGREQIVLVLRGTMSLNEIAVDLTCEAESFEPAQTPPMTEDDEHPIPGQFTFPSMPDISENKRRENVHHVHGGMLRMARLMGDVGKPVQLAVLEALHNNPEFELVLCGHSLGAGVAALLGMMWADPKTCLTVRSSGLPVGRRVSVYCFAPPSLTDASLSRLADKLIVSFVYSHDVVARLSLGSVRDLKNAALWLCEANETKEAGDGYVAVTTRARQWKAGQGTADDMDWFIAMRKTLEANMQNGNMYPPGRVLWAMRDSDLHPSHRLAKSLRPDKLRLFEVLDVEQVFSQLVFARDMLTAHMPHQYDKVLHDLL